MAHNHNECLYDLSQIETSLKFIIDDQVMGRHKESLSKCNELLKLIQNEMKPKILSGNHAQSYAMDIV